MIGWLDNCNDCGDVQVWSASAYYVHNVLDIYHHIAIVLVCAFSLKYGALPEKSFLCITAVILWHIAKGGHWKNMTYPAQHVIQSSYLFLGPWAEKQLSLEDPCYP